MKKIILLLLVSFGLSAQQKIKFKQLENPATSSVNLGAQTFSAGGISILSNSTTIGTGTVAANTTSLGILRVKQGISWTDIGELATGNAAIWFNQTPTTTNYSFLGNNNGVSIFNAASTGSLAFRINNTGVGNWSSTGLRVGSTTAASATLDVTGTMSVSSTATITGGLSLNGGYGLSISSGSLNSGSNTNQIGNLRLLSSSAATLTTGNTGTISVLSDAVFPVQFNNSSVSPADGATYYIGNLPYGSITSEIIGRHYLPYNCTLIGWSMSNIADGVAGSAESVSVSVRVNNATDVSLSTSITFSTSTSYTASGLSTNFSAGDLISIKVVCPTWVTNPTLFYSNLTLWFVRRQ